MAIFSPAILAGSFRRPPAVAVPGVAATTFAVTPTVQYHPNAQAGTVTKSGSTITACPDLQGLAALSATVGPTEMTDALGRKFWRFDIANAAIIANTLINVSARGCTVFMVGRVHKHKAAHQFWTPRYSAYTDDTTNTAFAGGSIMRTTVTSSAPPYLSNAGISASTDATNKYKVIPGSQLGVWGVVSRTTANGATRWYCNNDVATGAQNSIASTTCTGGLIGATPSGTNVVTPASGFDLYEFVLWVNGTLTNGQTDAFAAALVTNYSVTALARQLVLEGDSITDGIPTTLTVIPGSGDNVGMQMTAPGASMIPDDCRLINLGTSGNQTSNLVTKRDTTNTMFDSIYPGGATKNIVCPQIGRNDVAESAGKKSAAMLYTDVVALINTTTTGYLQRGWSVIQVCNIAGPSTATVTNGVSTIQARIEAFRALVADTTNHLPLAQFKIDTLSDAGNTFDGLVNVLHLYDVTISAQTLFKTITDSTNSAAGYYDSDITHLRVAGLQAMASGGDTPQYGYGSLL